MGKHRSGHSYQEFPILNVARRCGLVLNDRTLEWEEVEASCPFCGDHGPGKHHLFLNTTRNIFRCVLCGEKGNSVSLYAKMEGVSNRQAFRALSEDSVLYRFPQQPLSQKPAEREPSSLAVRHNVYYDMLMHLELSPKHKADLLARGLSEERIEQNMYRTLPMSSSARRFLAGILSDFHNLEGVPGFYVDRGYWNILGHSGLLVPCRDRNGYIQGLQIRLDDETKPDRKYRWLSSRGKAHGTRSYSYIHVTGNIHARTAYLTEGGLKGDVASFLDHDALFLCFAGVTAIAGLKDALQSMENLEEVVVALDMDKLVNWRVRNALGKILETVQSIPNLRVRLMNWNMTFKGGLKGCEHFGYDFKLYHHAPGKPVETGISRAGPRLYPHLRVGGINSSDRPADCRETCGHEESAILSEAPVGRQSGLSAPCQRQRRGDRRPAPILGLSADGVSDGDGLSEQAVGHAHSGIGPASERRTLCQPTVYAAGVELRQSFPHTGRFMWTRNTNRQAGTLSVRPAIKRQPKI